MRHPMGKLRVVLVVLDASDEKLRKLAEDNQIRRLMLLRPDAERGAKQLAAYKIDPAVTNTVMLYEGYVVKQSWFAIGVADLPALRQACAPFMARSDSRSARGSGPFVSHRNSRRFVMRTWMFVPILALGLVGCRFGDFLGPAKPRSRRSSLAPIRPGLIPIAPANASIKFTGSTAISSQDGWFDAFDGALQMLTADPKDATVRATVDMTSTKTNIGSLLTKHLKGEEFFDIARFPTAQFMSERIIPTSVAGIYQVTGQFTFHGVQRTMMFPARIIVTGDEIALDAILSLSQTAFGMTEAAKKTKDEVKVTVSVRGRRR